MKTIQLCLLLVFASSLAVDGAETSDASKPARLDVLVFAPHPDDEVLGCAGVMLRALGEKRQVGVVVLTNGDGFLKAASVIVKKPQDQLVAKDFLKLAATRQQQSLDGLKCLGFPKSNLMFLGYPDSMLAEMYRSEGNVVYRQKFTEKSQTYSAVGTDYHSSIHDRPAHYTRASILGDIADIIETCKPSEIYVTHDVDHHPDHKAAFWFVRDATGAVGYQGKLYTYVVHGQQEPDLPVHRVPLTRAQVEKKRAAIQKHQIPTVHDSLVLHAKDEEVFWLSSTRIPPEKRR